MEEVAIDICLISKTVGRKYRPRIDYRYGCDSAERCTTFTLKLNDDFVGECSVGNAKARIGLGGDARK